MSRNVFARWDWDSRKTQWIAAVAFCAVLVTLFTVSYNAERNAENTPLVAVNPPLTNAGEEVLAQLSALLEELDLFDGELPEEVISVAEYPDKLLLPEGYAVSRRYGYGYDQSLDDYRFHRGVDIDLPVGDLVYALAEGVVEYIGLDGEWNGIVRVARADGLTVSYYGVIFGDLCVGDALEAGELIGTVSPAPAAEMRQAPHLHIEITKNGEIQDPAAYLS